MAGYAKTKEAVLNIPTIELYLRQDITIWCQGAEGKYNIYKLTNTNGKLEVIDVTKNTTRPG